MDCVSRDGDAVLAYAAHLRWRKLAVAYESVLEVRGSAAPASRSSITPHAEPVVAGPLVSWRSASLGVDASWCSLAAHIRETIYQSQEGSIEWSCVVPAGTARVRTKTGEMGGVGYVELLHMTLAPWRLPIRSLRWGRVTAEDESIVWIQWAGGFEATFVYDGGARVTAAWLDDEHLDLADGTTLALDRGRVVRRGALGTTVGASVPALRRLGPAGMLAVEECKWLSRATVKRPGRPAKDTWAIHEVVTWPKTPELRPA
jgi:hypothetical protein